MKLLYLDCGMGAAGDMLAAALLELTEDREGFLEEVNRLGIPGVHVRKEAAEKCGIKGTQLCVTVKGQEEESYDHHHHDDPHGHDHHHHDHDHHDHHHHHHEHYHSSLHDIDHYVRNFPLSDKVKKDIMAVYGLIAEAESRVHGKPVSEIHFHEVGNLDAVADITMVCMLMERLNPQKVVVSPVHTGSGQVRCAHGILPVPAPATAHILRDVPIYSGHIRGELCTPTGAALLKYFAHSFGPMPVMQTDRIGYGMGKKAFEAANCIRALLGKTGETAEAAEMGIRPEVQSPDMEREEILELCCNVDDMTAEQMGFAMERLFEAGALDVYTVPAGMKKNRPGTILHIMCHVRDRDALLGAVFLHTTTIGVRESRFVRYVLKRRTQVQETPYGPVRCKVSSGYGTWRGKWEYEDLAEIAQKEKLSLPEVQERLREYMPRLTEEEAAEKGECN